MNGNVKTASQLESLNQKTIPNNDDETCLKKHLDFSLSCTCLGIRTIIISLALPLAHKYTHTHTNTKERNH